jgi:hypothetical protein
MRVKGIKQFLRKSSQAPITLVIRSDSSKVAAGLSHLLNVFIRHAHRLRFLDLRQLRSVLGLLEELPPPAIRSVDLTLLGQRLVLDATEASLPDLPLFPHRQLQSLCIRNIRFDQIYNVQLSSLLHLTLLNVTVVAVEFYKICGDYPSLRTLTISYLERTSDGANFDLFDGEGSRSADGH